MEGSTVFAAIIPYQLFGNARSDDEVIERMEERLHQQRKALKKLKRKLAARAILASLLKEAASDDDE